MKKILVTLFYVVTALTPSVFAQSKNGNWFNRISTIKPGQSTRKQIESLFPTLKIVKSNRFQSTEDIYYDSNEGLLQVTYSLRGCPGGTVAYDLETGTVISFLFRANRPIKLSKLNLSLRDFTGRKEDDTSNWYYTSPDQGTVYVLFNKNVFEVERRMTASEKARFTCGTD
jgi:hypothetical protein